MRMPWRKSKGEPLDLLDATAVASTDSIAFDECGAGAVEGATRSDVAPQLPRDAGASQWTVWDDRYLQLPGNQSVGKTVLNLKRPCETRPLGRQGLNIGRKCAWMLGRRPQGSIAFPGLFPGFSRAAARHKFRHCTVQSSHSDRDIRTCWRVRRCALVRHQLTNQRGGMTWQEENCCSLLRAPQ